MAETTAMDTAPTFSVLDSAQAINVNFWQPVLWEASTKAFSSLDSVLGWLMSRATWINSMTFPRSVTTKSTSRLRAVGR